MPGDQHVWHRPWLWDAYYAVVLAATLLIVLTLGVSDRTAAVTTAIERGDIPPPGR